MIRNIREPWAFTTALSSLFFVAVSCLNCSKPAGESDDKPLKQFSEEITSETTSLVLKVGEAAFVPVTIKNMGAEKWSAAGAYPVHLSYLWFADGKQLPLDTTRTLLPSDIPPGTSQALKANVAAPPSAGKYTLKFTMVQERVAWFASAGAKTLDVPVNVQ